MKTTAPWPVIAGTYQVGDPQGPVAVCTLTTEHLIDPLAHRAGVAIAGKVYTANLGIERIVANITANPAIRFLLLCGKESVLFRPGQSLVALAEQGLDGQRRIKGARGYDPMLPTLALTQVTRFQRQIEIVDWTGEEDLTALAQCIDGLVARNPGQFATTEESEMMPPLEEQFVPIRPGGQRDPLQYDPKGYFVITLDRAEEQIILRHYRPDNTPAHEMRGRMAGSMLLGLLREGLVTQLSHAGYLGEELAKAQAALHLGLRYDQDRPLRPAEATAEAIATPSSAATVASEPPAPAAPPAGMGQIPPALTWAQLQTTALGTEVDVAIAVTDQSTSDLLAGVLLEADEAEPFSAFHRTDHQVQVRWSYATRIVMGGPPDLHVGSLIRAHGVLQEDQVVVAKLIAVLTSVSRIIEP